MTSKHLLAPSLVSVFFLACSGLEAQNSLVLPPTQTAKEGNSLDHEPFGTDRIRHAHYIGREYLAALPNQASLKSLAYRRDGELKTPAVMTRTFRTTKPKPVWTVRLGNDPRTGGLNPPPYTYPDANATYMTMVVNGMPFDFPDLTLPASGLPAFSIKFMFSRPFVYNPANSNPRPHLIIDHYAYETQNRNYTYMIDCVQGSSQEPERAVLTSATSFGCPKGQNRATGLAGNPGAGSLDFYLFGAPQTATVWACLGASETSWSGLPLPFDLGAIGLSGCKIYNDQTVVIPQQTNTSGSASFSTPIPGNASLAGRSLYGQWVVSDTRVSKTTPYATSDSLKWTLPKTLGNGQPEVAVVSAIGSNARSRSGFVQPGRGPVVQINW